MPESEAWSVDWERLKDGGEGGRGGDGGIGGTCREREYPGEDELEKEGPRLGWNVCVYGGGGGGGRKTKQKMDGGGRGSAQKTKQQIVNVSDICAVLKMRQEKEEEKDKPEQKSLRSGWLPGLCEWSAGCLVAKMAGRFPNLLAGSVCPLVTAMAGDECGLCLRCRPDLYRKTPKTSVAVFFFFFTALKNWVMVRRKTPLPLPPPTCSRSLLPSPPPHPTQVPSWRAEREKLNWSERWHRPAQAVNNDLQTSRQTTQRTCPGRRDERASTKEKKLGRLAHPTHKHKHVSPLPSGFRYAQLAAHSKPRFLALFLPALP